MWVFFVAFLFVGVVMVVLLLTSVLGLVAVFSNNPDNLFGFLGLWWLIIPAFLIISLVWAKLTVHFYRYELTDAGFRKELGVIYKKYVTVPYDRIQNVDINRGILDRLLGLSSLMIQTAGASSGVAGATEGVLPGLSREVAEQLRDELIARARQSKNQGL